MDKDNTQHAAQNASQQGQSTPGASVPVSSAPPSPPRTTSPTPATGAHTVLASLFSGLQIAAGGITPGAVAADADRASERAKALSETPDAAQVPLPSSSSTSLQQPTGSSHVEHTGEDLSVPEVQVTESTPPTLYEQQSSPIGTVTHPGVGHPITLEHEPAPSVPPKDYVHGSTLAVPASVYVPTPISTSIHAQMTTDRIAATPAGGIDDRHVLTRSPSPMPVASGSGHTSAGMHMPGTFPTQPHTPSILQTQGSVLPTHQPQPRRLSWDDQVFQHPSHVQSHSAGPSSPRDERPMSPSSGGSLNVLHVPPLTPIGSGPYPPLSASPIQTPLSADGPPRNGNGNGGYFAHHSNGNGHGVQRPQRAHSQIYPSSRQAYMGDGHSERPEGQRRVSAPLTEDYGHSEGTGRREPMRRAATSHEGYSYRGDGRSEYRERYRNSDPYVAERDPTRRASGHSNSPRRSGVDLSQVPVLEGGHHDTRSNGHAARSANGHAKEDEKDESVKDDKKGFLRGLMSTVGLGGGRGGGEKKRQPSSIWDEVSTNSRERTIAERLRPTLIHAQEELRQARVQARATGWSLNVAIGAQVLLGALTTGVAAATSGRQTSIATTILGGLSTLAASYLAKARGSGEPEASSGRCKDLENFVRELENTVLDRGHLSGHEYDDVVGTFRSRFEEIMGNVNSGVNVGEFMKEKVVDAYHSVQPRVQQLAHHVHLPQNLQNMHLPHGVSVQEAAKSVEAVGTAVEGTARSLEEMGRAVSGTVGRVESVSQAVVSRAREEEARLQSLGIDSRTQTFAPTRPQAGVQQSQYLRAV